MKGLCKLAFCTIGKFTFLGDPLLFHGISITVPRLPDYRHRTTVSSGQPRCWRSSTTGVPFSTASSPKNNSISCAVMGGPVDHWATQHSLNVWSNSSAASFVQRSQAANRNYPNNHNQYCVPSLKESLVSRRVSGDFRDFSGVVSRVMCVRFTLSAPADCQLGLRCVTSRRAVLGWFRVKRLLFKQRSAVADSVTRSRRSFFSLCDRASTHPFVGSRGLALASALGLNLPDTD